MKKSLVFFLLFTISSLLLVTLSHSEHTLFPLTDNQDPQSHLFYYLQINNNNYAVWKKSNDCFLYEFGASGHTVQLSVHSFTSCREPQLNDNNYVVWFAQDPNFDIILYDGNSTMNLTDDVVLDSYPSINNNNYVVWLREEGGYQQIFLYDGTTIVQLTDTPFYKRYPKISNNNQVVWRRSDGSGNYSVVLDGTEIPGSQISSEIRGLQINDNGYVVWHCLGTNRRAFVYYGVNVTELIYNGSVDNRTPYINNNNQVVWDADAEIILYDGTDMVPISNIPTHGQARGPRINDSDYVVWTGSNSVFLYDGTIAIELIENYHHPLLTLEYAHLNDNNYVFWIAYEPDWDGVQNIFRSPAPDLVGNVKQIGLLPIEAIDVSLNQPNEKKQIAKTTESGRWWFDYVVLGKAFKIKIERSTVP